MDDRIKLKKVDHLKFFLTIVIIIVVLIISSIFITAFKMGINNNHDFVLSGNTYFDESTTLVYRFFNDDSGRLLAYEKNEEDESSTLVDNKSFTYVVDEIKYSVTLTFKDDEQTFYFINNALFDSNNNLYLYLLN